MRVISIEVPLEEVVAVDFVQVRPGERVPVYVQVTNGSSYVDESMINGEPVPVSKERGAPNSARSPGPRDRT